MRPGAPQQDAADGIPFEPPGARDSRGSRLWERQKLKIAHELRMRGVGREEIESVLDDAEDESERARELAESWRKSGVEDRKIVSRLLSRFSN